MEGHDIDLIDRRLWRHYQSWHRSLRAELGEKVAKQQMSIIGRVIVDFSDKQHHGNHFQYVIPRCGTVYVPTTAKGSSYMTFQSGDRLSMDESEQLSKIPDVVHPIVYATWCKWAEERTDPEYGLTLVQFIALMQQCAKLKRL